MHKWPFMMMLLCFVNVAQALQIKSVVDNETVSIKISSVDVTRIFVQNDRIKSVKGIKGAYTRENDEKNGEIYLQPTTLFQHRSFTVLIDTEQGRHFTLLLNPTASPSETLMLVPKGVGRLRAARFEQAASYELTINHLIRHMKHHTMPEGYAVYEVGRSPVFYREKHIRLCLKAIYQGLHLRGEVYTVTNLNKTPLYLDEKTFYKRGTRAISLDTVVIAPKATVYLYRVLSQ